MHCHVDLYPDPNRVVSECKSRGIYVLSVTTVPKAWHGTSKLAYGCPRIRTALGLHPQVAHHREHELELFDALLPNAKFVGEIGLDGGRDFRKHKDVQLKVFRHILNKVNEEQGRIMTIHSRNSASSVINELSNIEGIPILHWFTGTLNELKKAINIGCWFSVGPAMLNSEKGRNIVSNIPLDRILTETDGPFVKVSGRAAFPWDAGTATKKIATLRNFNLKETEELIDCNFKRLVS